MGRLVMFPTWRSFFAQAAVWLALAAVLWAVIAVLVLAAVAVAS